MIETIEKDGITYFKAQDAFHALGLTWRNVHSSLRRRGITDSFIRRSRGLFELHEKEKFKDNEPVFIQKKAFERLMSISTKCNSETANKLITEYDLNINVYFERNETLILDIIEEIIKNHQDMKNFEELSFLRQHPFGMFNVDMYIPQLSLVIEIDEKGNHTSARQIKMDAIRERVIKEEFSKEEYNIHFFRVRQNSYAKDIGRLINALNFDNDICELDEY